MVTQLVLDPASTLGLISPLKSCKVVKVPRFCKERGIAKTSGRTIGEVLEREPDSHGQLLVRIFPEGPRR